MERVWFSMQESYDQRFCLSPDVAEMVLSDQEIEATLDFLCSEQRESGFIPWTACSHGDPWNHSEVVIALLLGGRFEEARKGLDWILYSQNQDGSLCQYYLPSGVKEPKRDLNCCSYPYLALLLGIELGVLDIDEALLRSYMVSSVKYILSYQDSAGGFPWAVDPDGQPYEGRLLSGSSSMVTSFQAAIEIMKQLSLDPSELAVAEKALSSLVVKSRLENFLDKSVWAMDWYYPILAKGAEVEEYQHRVSHLFADNFEPGYGVCCLSTSRWVTTAETAEFAMALSIVGRQVEAENVLKMTSQMRWRDGSYLTGVTVPSMRSFPNGERSTYSAAAVIIANSVLSNPGGELLTSLRPKAPNNVTKICTILNSSELT